MLVMSSVEWSAFHPAEDRTKMWEVNPTQMNIQHGSIGYSTQHSTTQFNSTQHNATHQNATQHMHSQSRTLKSTLSHYQTHAPINPLPARAHANDSCTARRTIKRHSPGHWHSLLQSRNRRPITAHSHHSIQHPLLAGRCCRLRFLPLPPARSPNLH